MGAITPVPGNLIHDVPAERWNRADHITGLPAVSGLPASSQYLTWTGYVAVPTDRQVQVLTAYSGCQVPAATQVVETSTQIKVGVQTKKPDPGVMCPAIARESIVVLSISSAVGSRTVVPLGP